MFLIIVSACIKTEEPVETEGGSAKGEAHGTGSTQSDNAGAQESEGGRQSERTLTLKPAGQQAEEEEKPNVEEERVRKPLPVSSREEMLSLKSGQPIAPYDFEIGKLQQRWSENREENSIYELLRGFFSAFQKGTLDTTYVHPQWKDHVTRMLRYPLENNLLPNEVRIGILSIEGSNAHANIRLLSRTGTTEGEIYLEYSEQSWYVTDLQIDFLQLKEPYSRDEQFEPDIYRWLDLE